jgi:Flp pilus assembly protein TadG
VRKSVPVHRGDHARLLIARRQSGAAAVAAVLFLPALLATMTALLSLGQGVWYRNLAYQAADLGALAGVQAVDLDQLALGKVRLVTDEARNRATEYARANIALSHAPALPALVIQVEVINPSGAETRDPVTGRLLEYPTVCVALRFPVSFRVGPLAWVQNITAHADASVVPR